MVHLVIQAFSLSILVLEHKSGRRHSHILTMYWLWLAGAATFEIVRIAHDWEHVCSAAWPWRRTARGLIATHLRTQNKLSNELFAGFYVLLAATAVLGCIPEPASEYKALNEDPVCIASRTQVVG
jgi:hypothetical protein